MQLPQLRSNMEYIRVLYECDFNEQIAFYREEADKLFQGLEILMREFGLGDEESIARGREHSLKAVESNYWSGYRFIGNSLRQSEKITMDWFEGFLDPQDFSELIAKIRDACYGRFNAEKIECDEINSQITFLIDGEQKTFPFNFTGGPVSEGFMDELYTLLSERGISYWIEDDILFFLPDNFKRIADENRYLSVDSGQFDRDSMPEDEWQLVKDLSRVNFLEGKEMAVAELRRRKLF